MEFIQIWRLQTSTLIEFEEKQLKIQHFIHLHNKIGTGTHSGRYGHNNETLILQNFAFIMQFYTYSNPYDMN